MVCASQIFLERSYHIPKSILQKEHRENVKHLHDSEFIIVSYPMQAPSLLFEGTAHIRLQQLASCMGIRSLNVSASVCVLTLVYTRET
jgi:hypothetical protein